jgi:DNA-binding FadR family transcriptional regulator
VVQDIGYVASMDGVSCIGGGIVKGRYPPGSLLPREPELIAKFDVSRTALREALKVLAAKGLVPLQRGRHPQCCLVAS